MERVFGSTPIYWINLDSSIDRRNNMERQLKNLNHKRIQAIDGVNPDISPKITITNPIPKYTTALNSVVCSHIKSIKTAYDNGLEHVIILEDKCHFDFIEYFDNTIDKIVEKITHKDPLWEVVQLSSIPLCELSDYLLNGLKFYPWNRHSGLNYLINRKGMERFLAKVNTNGIDTFDLINFNRCIDPETVIYGNLNTYVMNFPILYVYAEKSTFPYYFVNNKNDRMKQECLKAQIKTKDTLYNFIMKHFTKK